MERKIVNCQVVKEFTGWGEGAVITSLADHYYLSNEIPEYCNSDNSIHYHVHILSDEDVKTGGDYVFNLETNSAVLLVTQCPEKCCGQYKKIIATTDNKLRTKNSLIYGISDDFLTEYCDKRFCIDRVFIEFEYNDHIKNKHIYTDMGYPLPFGYDPEAVAAPTPGVYIGWFPITNKGDIVINITCGNCDIKSQTIPTTPLHEIPNAPLLELDLGPQQKVFYESEVYELCEDAIYYGIGLGDSADKKNKIDKWLKRNIR